MYQPEQRIHVYEEAEPGFDDMYIERRPKKRRPLLRLIKWSLLIFLTPFILAFVLTLFYSFIPPLSIPVIGQTLSGGEIHWRWRSFENISPNITRAIIAAEDGRFCDHKGVDWIAVEKVVNHAQKKGKLTRGASTIPMQTAKNLFLWPLPDIVRKPLEVPLAMWMDYVWSKRRMMEIYMNIAQFGDGIYGVEAASQVYFLKSARSLNADEASVLAAVLPNPEKRVAVLPSQYVRRYAGTIKARAGGSQTGCLK